MSNVQPDPQFGHRLVLLRHGETLWSKIGQHTGATDIGLTATGQMQARSASAVINGLELVNPLVLCSPRQRAIATAELAGLKINNIYPDLAEWDYGAYEGLTSAQIRENISEWTIWTHGATEGESITDIRLRADRVLDTALKHLAIGDVLFVGHGHFSRALLARWITLPIALGKNFSMAPASIAICGFEHGQKQITALGLTGY
ncbi:MAG: acid phosphatase [Mycobacteriaceae bacterium]